MNDRIWCGNGANPSGILVSFLANVNPFRNIPIVGKWVFNADFRIYALVATKQKIPAETQIDILNEMIQIENMVEQYRSGINVFVNTTIGDLPATVQHAISQVITF